MSFLTFGILGSAGQLTASNIIAFGRSRKPLNSDRLLMTRIQANAAENL
jgi:hypothetical protein